MTVRSLFDEIITDQLYIRLCVQILYLLFFVV